MGRKNITATKKDGQVYDLKERLTRSLDTTDYALK